jgi:alkanesulfonate monooxygenase SsuD/methylene tetrahydromethanopterin reductase-like flavin-dependent oxidoreductase (luciferase family)
MEFGILFTSQPNLELDAYPYADLQARVTGDILLADRLGYDVAWLAEHHFSDTYGIMPDVMTFAAYLAPQTRDIKLGTGVVVLPLNNVVRVVENACFNDLLSGGRFRLGIGSGYRKYEFDGLGIDFDSRRDVQVEALEVMLKLFRERRIDFEGNAVRSHIGGDYELFPHSLQRPHPPLYMAAGSEQSIAAAARYGFALMLSSLPRVDVMARQTARYRELLDGDDAAYRDNPPRGDVLINRFVYVADSDAEAKADSEAGVLKHLAHIGGQGNYMTTVDSDTTASNYDDLLGDVVVHGSPDTVAGMLAEIQERTGMSGLILHYPPYYGPERITRSLTLFAEEVMPRFRDPAATRGAAE